jgi:hypothetical protein
MLPGYQFVAHPSCRELDLKREECNMGQDKTVLRQKFPAVDFTNVPDGNW